MTVPLMSPPPAVAAAMPLDTTALSNFRKERIKSLSALYENAEGGAYFVETTRVADRASTVMPATLLAPVSAEHCAAGANAAREVSDDLGWNARWEIVDGVIVARYEDAQGDLVTRTGFDFYAKLAERLGPGLFQALEFDIVSGSE